MFLLGIFKRERGKSYGLPGRQLLKIQYFCFGLQIASIRKMRKTHTLHCLFPGVYFSSKMN